LKGERGRAAGKEKYRGKKEKLMSWLKYRYHIPGTIWQLVGLSVCKSFSNWLMCILLETTACGRTVFTTDPFHRP
jgi:hypothetical protein